jgi:ADP-ribose pyrophosphatase
MSKDKPTRFPDNAQKVFEGVLYDVYQWPQKLYDGTTVTYERLNRQDTAIVIGITPDNQILLVDEEQPHIARGIKLVAGKIDPGETPEDAAKRELLEETGYQAKSLHLWYQSNPDVNVDWTVYTYIAKNVIQVATQQLEGGEKITPKLVSFEQFLDIVSAEKFRGLELKTRILEAKLMPEKMSELKKLLTTGN